MRRLAWHMHGGLMLRHRVAVHPHPPGVRWHRAPVQTQMGAMQMHRVPWPMHTMPWPWRDSGFVTQAHTIARCRCDWHLAPSPTYTPINLKLGIRGFSILEKLNKGTLVISFSKDNPAVPGNGPVLAAFETQQDLLQAQIERVRVLEGELRAARAALASEESAWDSAFRTLGIFTESATGGMPAAVLGAGFDLRRTARTLPQVEAPTEVTVDFTDWPGESLLTWKRPKGAVAFILQWTADFRDEASWKSGGTVTDTQEKLRVAEPVSENPLALQKRLHTVRPRCR